jgi:hypothetical protein
MKKVKIKGKFVWRLFRILHFVLEIIQLKFEMVTCLLVLTGEKITRSLSRESIVSMVSISTRVECFVKRIVSSKDNPHIYGFF